MAEAIDWIGLGELNAALERIQSGLGASTRAAVAEGAHLIERLAKQNAPVKTGTLRRSVSVFGPTSIGAGTYQALIGPTVIYGRRIELGFHGTDSLGRSYNQQGKPYLGPAYDAVVGGGALEAIFVKHWANALGR